MPLYLFSNPKKPKEIIEIFMGMNETHEYIKNGIKWNREWTKPTAATDTNWNENSSHDFVEKTAKKKGSIGDMIDLSKELSEKRAHKLGVSRDPILQKKYDTYRKETRGKRHHAEIKEAQNNTIVV